MDPSFPRVVESMCTCASTLPTYAGTTQTQWARKGTTVSFTALRFNSGGCTSASTLPIYAGTTQTQWARKRTTVSFTALRFNRDVAISKIDA